MKISGYYKSLNNEVELITDYDLIKESNSDKIYLSKVFSDTNIPEWVLELDNIKYGGTGFYYDKAPFLPNEIEYHMPDYNLYNDFIKSKLDKGEKRNRWKYYLDYSIGFTTRGCFRQCDFCVNKRYTKVHKHSSVEGFLDNERKYITLLDDNILGFGQWKEVIKELQDTGRRFEYKQGMDMRLMTEEKAKILNNSKYIGDYIFAFDHIKDKELIEEKLKLWKKYNSKTTKLYVLVAHESQDVNDIINAFKRIKILMKYGCLPYIMRYKDYEDSEYRGMYINLARWCNQPSLFKKKSLREFVYEVDGKGRKNKMYASKRYLENFQKKYPEVAAEYFDIKYEDLKQY